jgi:hypothetical protein
MTNLHEKLSYLAAAGFQAYKVGFARQRYGGQSPPYKRRMGSLESEYSLPEEVSTKPLPAFPTGTFQRPGQFYTA